MKNLWLRIRNYTRGKLTTIVAGIVPAFNGRPTQSQSCLSEDNVLNCYLEKVYTHSTSVSAVLFGAISIILLVYAGIQYITSAGNPDQVKKARQTLTNVVLAILLLLVSFTLINIILATTRFLAGGITD